MCTTLCNTHNQSQQQFLPSAVQILVSCEPAWSLAVLKGMRQWHISNVEELLHSHRIILPQALVDHLQHLVIVTGAHWDDHASPRAQLPDEDCRERVGSSAHVDGIKGAPLGE